MDSPQSLKLFHDLKNDFASMTALINLHRIYTGQYGAEELMNRLQERQVVLSLAYEKLYQNGNYPFINLKIFIEDLCSRESRLLSGYCSNINLAADIIDLELPMKKALPIAQISAELLSNSYRHAFIDYHGTKDIKLSIKHEGPKLILDYSDNGSGLPENINPERSKTLGMQFIKSLSRQMGCKAEFDSSEDGLSVRIIVEKIL